MSGTESLSIRLHPADNVVVARLALMPGAALPAEGIAAAASIPAGHKVATAPISAGEPIRKYDQIIGFATDDIAPGDHVHVHNVEMRDFERDYAFSSAVKPTDYVPEANRATFQGFLRPGGMAGTRNYIGILTSVNCSATVAKYIAAAITPEILAQYPNVDGVVALVHSTGCGMADSGEGYANLQRTLWGHARHPNFAGILMVGLGCEVNQIDFLLEAYGLERGPRFQTMTIQDIGGTRKTVDRGVEIVKSMLPAANEAQRTALPASHLTLALQCGGSDAYSGITANPALGAAADLLVRHGGTAILSETPEIYGAEHLLTRRAIDRKTGEKLIERIRWWEEYTRRNGGEMNNNPSPGNKAGGLTTILEKSLGAAAKGGTSNLTGVFKYAEPINTKGFVFMDSPGYDPCSVTGQVASGANIVCFTTGRGSVFGNKPSPSLKLATNSAMYRKLEEDMDVNCGDVLDAGVSIQEMGQRIFELILRVSSGEKSKSEAQGFGDAEFIPWQVGAVM
ncbi:UxaA family hydrolase [Oceanibaculum nanhaiense]|jgi:altronate hydrolase|uniref:UxaA family hydrolase n=1 Tax=Oceanibaculum nanhaiense TaxID=1909734 RepID=UPI000A37BDC3|nr:altronate dehydratase family protein [Oceanibaculum nanhaiense]